jgi:hypothetical protein
VNVVDARTFDSVQSIMVSPPGGDMHISGIAFAPDSSSVFVGLENTVLEYGVDTIQRRSFAHGDIFSD